MAEKIKHLASVAMVTILCLLLSGCTKEETVPSDTEKYLLLIGEDRKIVETVPKTELLVIDGEYFTREDILRLKERGVGKIYSYVNIGALEDFRDFYDDFVQFTLADYENWPGERWIDVSAPEWQKFIQGRLAELSEKGFDGFFLDNFDIYYLYPQETIYGGLIDILRYIRSLERETLINGGDVFVREYIRRGGEPVPLFDGVNQENVYTHYDFASGRFRINLPAEREYFDDYLETVMESGFSVYVTEYANRAKTAEKALEHSAEHGYRCCVSDNIELMMNGSESE